MNGTPIFDDYHFIFSYNVVKDDFSYLTIFKDFSWPVSVSFERVIYQVFGENFFVFHLINVLLHALNSFMLFKLADKLKLPYPKILGLLFLLHPANVISVSWMVQLKTVVCLTFALISVFFLLKSQEDKKFYLVSWLFFLLSVLAKSASIPLVLIYIFYAMKSKGVKETIWTIPFMLVSLYSTYKVINSEMTTVASKQIHSKTFVAEEKSGKVVVPEKPVAAPKTKVDILPAPEEKVEKSATAVHNEGVYKVFEKTSTLLKTGYYYFWQVVLPLENYPVKGLSFKLAGLTEVFHFIFVCILLFLTRHTWMMFALISGYLFLMPFLGFTDAPYMTLTWVSEQHLYLAIPFFLAFWLGALEKIKSKYALIIPGIFLIFFSVQTYKATTYYKDDVTFYTISLKADPYNLPIAYNLAIAYLRRNDLPQALNVTGTILDAASTKNWIARNKYFPYISTLHGKMVREGLKEP